MNTQSIPNGHKTKAVSLPSLAGKWGAQCSCGWVSEPQYGTGARDRARSAGYDHEIDAEEIMAEPVPEPESKPWETPDPGELWELNMPNCPPVLAFAHWANDELVYVTQYGDMLTPTLPVITTGVRVDPAGGERR